MTTKMETATRKMETATRNREKAQTLLALVCDEYGVTEQRLKGMEKTGHLAQARRRLCVLLWEGTTLSGRQINSMLGRRNYFRTCDYDRCRGV